MRRRNHLGLAVIAAVAGAALTGCGGGSGGSTPADPLASGRAALNRLAGSQTAADAPTLQSILDQFQKALQQQPSSSEAHFGVALCMAGLAGDELDGGPSSIELASSTVARPGMSSGGALAAAGGGKAGPSAGGPGATPPLPSPPANGDVPPAPDGHTLPPQPLPPAHKLALLWNIDSSLANPYALLNMLAPLGSIQYGIVPFYGYSQDSGDLARRQHLLQVLTTVDQNLQAVEADPNFSTTLPDPNRDGQQVTVGLPEVQLFDAYVNSLRVEVALSLAYVRDPGNEHLIPVDPPVPVNGGGPPAIFASGGGSGSAGSGGVSGGSTGGGTIVPTVPPSPFASLDANHDGKLTPDEYLPPSPFLTLRDPALLTTAQKAMLATADQETKGINGVLARPADAVFLVSNTDAVRAVLTETRDKVVPLIQQAATGPVTIDVPRYGGPLAGAAGSGPVAVSGSDQGGVFSVAPKPPVPSGGAGVAILPIAFTTEPVTIDIAAWFKQPPADLKAFAPTYTLDANGFPDPSLTKYPDPTFGGLYPNGLPTDLML